MTCFKLAYVFSRSPILRVILAATLALALAGSIFAADLKIETISVAPFGMLGDDGKPTGMMYEISNKIAETAGLKYTNTLVPYARSVIGVSEGTADFVLRFSNPELQAAAFQLASIATMPTIIISKKGMPFATLDALHGKTVGMLRGGVFDDKFAKDEAIKKFEANDYDQILKMLFADRFEAAIGSNVGLYYIANKQGIAPEALSAPLILTTQDFILHFSKKNVNEATKTALKNAVEKLRKDGTIDKIISKYMGAYKWKVAGN